jgi:hypothetical protein
MITEETTAPEKAPATTELTVDGMSCGNCARHVTEALQVCPEWLLPRSFWKENGRGFAGHPAQHPTKGLFWLPSLKRDMRENRFWKHAMIRETTQIIAPVPGT